MKYQVTFGSTGKTFGADLQFGAGVTAITGENETGKSLILEMIRYALFGAAALRSAVSNYQSLSVSLSFEIGSDKYAVSRTPRIETLTKNGEVEATGKKTLNDAIPRLLGFNLRVFDVACSANQGDIEALTRMRPADRKQMVDSVIGLNTLDGIEKWTREEAVRRRREADAMSDALVAPVAPVPPANMQPAADLVPMLEAVEAQYREYVSLDGLRQPVPPEVPVAPEIASSIEELERHQQSRATALAEQSRLQKIVASIPAAFYTAEQLDAAVQWNEFVAEVARRGPRPQLMAEMIEAEEAAWELHDAWRPSEPCESCGFRATDAVQPPASEHSKSQLRAARLALAQWTAPLPAVDEGMAPKVPLTAAVIAAGRKALDMAEQKADAAEALLALDIPADRAADLRSKRAFETASAVFVAQQADFLVRMKAWDEAQVRLMELDGAPDRFAELRLRHTQLSVYEAQLDAFLRAEVAYDEAMDRVTEKVRTADGLRSGAEALRLTRTKVKQHLIPSMSRVASQYLASMTGGRRNSVVIDEDFDIIVDGQEIDELAGSAKAVVNLAVRLALGQVLTQRMFPVFLGDEIDAAMDPHRAEATTETLRGLTQRIQQVIIVSHKQVEADHQISL